MVKCGGVVNDNEVVFRSPDYPHQQAVYGQCQVTVHAREEVCQLRLDFSEFSLSPPETCGPRAGYCLDDAFSVSAGVESSSYPVLCGFNSGQHSTKTYAFLCVIASTLCQGRNQIEGCRPPKLLWRYCLAHLAYVSEYMFTIMSAMRLIHAL